MVLELGLECKFTARSTAWDENRVFLEGDKLEIEVKGSRWVLTHLPAKPPTPFCAKAQIQGAALWGASQVMAERLTLKDGAFEQSNFHDYTPISAATTARPSTGSNLKKSGLHSVGIGALRGSTMKLLRHNGFR